MGARHGHEPAHLHDAAGTGLLPAPRPPGRIIAWYRAGTSGSQPVPLWHYSDDDGQTWSAPVEAGAYWDEYSNPAAILYHDEDDLVEMLTASRTPAIGTISRVLASADDAVAGLWGGLELIGGGSASKNFGYVALARRPIPGGGGYEVFHAYYDGGDTDADIYIRKGTRSGADRPQRGRALDVTTTTAPWASTSRGRRATWRRRRCTATWTAAARRSSKPSTSGETSPTRTPTTATNDVANAYRVTLDDEVPNTSATRTR